MSADNGLVIIKDGQNMRLKMQNCPKCNRLTLQGEATVSKWKHKDGSHSILTQKVAVCLLCGSYIQRRQVMVEKVFDPSDYSLD